jgi:hypothetical protein
MKCLMDHGTLLNFVKRTPTIQNTNNAACKPNHHALKTYVGYMTLAASCYGCFIHWVKSVGMPQNQSVHSNGK